MASTFTTPLPTPDQDRALANLMCDHSSARVSMYLVFAGATMHVTTEDGHVHQFDEEGNRV